MKIPKTSLLSLFIGALALCILPSCGGGSSSATSDGTGDGTGGGTSSFAQVDLAGDWTGHLNADEASDLPWANGNQRILSRNAFIRANGNGEFTFANDGSDESWNLSLPNYEIATSSLTKKGIFSVLFKKKQTDQRELLLVGQLNAAKNYISGNYEFRLHTVPGEEHQLETIDAGTFWFSLSSGPGHFQASMFEGRWEGVNYHYAPRYLNCVLEIDAAGNLTDGGMMDIHGFKERRFAMDGSNDGFFAQFEDSSVGLFAGGTLHYQGGRVLEILSLVMDENRTFLSGPAIDINGHVSYLRLKRTDI